MKMCLQVKSERSKVNILLLLTIYHIQTSGLGTQYLLEAAGESLPYGVHLLLTDTDIGKKKQKPWALQSAWALQSVTQWRETLGGKVLSRHGG